MPDIRYVVLSDIHLGAENSILTNLKDGTRQADATKPSPVLVQLAACLRDLISRNEGRAKPKLVLNGDILELALAATNEAAMVFQRFIELTMPRGGELFDREIYYIPGNHDHHVWEMARETQYIRYVQRRALDEPLKDAWHVTRLFLKEEWQAVPSDFLTALLHRFEHLATSRVTTVYPNLGLVGEDRSRFAILHHGHFTESIYLLMSHLKGLLFPRSAPAGTVWAVEAENFAWIDFFWSTLGRSGDAGTDVGLVYDKLQSPEATGQLVANLVAGILSSRPAWERWLGTGPLTRLLRWWANRAASLEVRQGGGPLSAAAQKDIKAYVEGPLKAQILLENRDIPADLTFVFGHTHKPFQGEMTFDGYPGGVAVYNTGGWVVDTPQPQPLHGGAVVLLDENLNAATLRMYNETESPGPSRITVERASRSEHAANPLYDRVRPLVDAGVSPWSEFSAAAAEAVQVRRSNLLALIAAEV